MNLNPIRSKGQQPLQVDSATLPLVVHHQLLRVQDLRSDLLSSFKLSLSFHIQLNHQVIILLHVQIREEPPSYSTSVLQRFESFENPLAGHEAQTFGSQDDADGSENPQFGKALYDFTAGGDDEVSPHLDRQILPKLPSQFCRNACFQKMPSNLDALLSDLMQ